MNEEVMQEIQQKLWYIASEHCKGETPSEVLGTCAAMIKVALELYTVVLDDEAIGILLDEVRLSLPQQRESMLKRLGKGTVH